MSDHVPDNCFIMKTTSLDPDVAIGAWARKPWLERIGARLLSGRSGSVSLDHWLVRYRWRLLLICASLTSAVSFNHSGDAHALPIMLAIGVAATVSSIGGFAFSAIAGAMLFHLSDDTIRMVQIMITCSIANQFSMVWAIRKTIVWKDLKPFLPGGLLGVLVGVGLLLTIDRNTFTNVLGIFLASYGGFMLLRKQRVCTIVSPTLDTLVAFLSGVAGGMVGFPSAFIAPWIGLRGWDKTRQRALFQPFILIMQLVSLTVISLTPHPGAGHSGYLMANTLFIPVSLLGTTIGLALYGRLSNQQFSMVMNATLMLNGIAYLL